MSELVESVVAHVARDTKAAENRRARASSIYAQHVLSGMPTEKTVRDLRGAMQVLGIAPAELAADVTVLKRIGDFKQQLAACQQTYAALRAAFQAAEAELQQA